MKLANMIAAGAALAAGLVGGTATYLVAAEPGPTSEAPPARTTEVSATSSDPTVAPGKPIVKLARCKAPAVREGKACVTEVVETVVLPAPSSVSTGTSSDDSSGDEDHGSGAHSEDDDSVDSGAHDDDGADHDDGDDDPDDDADDHGDDGDHDSGEDEGDDD
jgi:hypothetical protein